MMVYPKNQIGINARGFVQSMLQRRSKELTRSHGDEVGKIFALSHIEYGNLSYVSHIGIGRKKKRSVAHTK